MKRVITNNTLENSAFTVGSANVSTTIAGLTREMTVHENDAFAKHCCFVLDEGQQLFCAPISNQTSRFSSRFAFPLHTARFQFFECDSIAILVNNSFRDAMIYVSDEPSLSTTQTAQMPFCVSSACSLKASLQIFISSFDFTQFFAVEKSVITRDCWIVNSSINTNDFLNVFQFWDLNFNDDVEEYSSFFSSDSCAVRTFEIVPFEIVGNFDGIPSSSRNRADANHFRIGQESESVMIESYRTMLFFGGLSFEFEPFEHIAGLVSNSSNEAAIKFGVCSSDATIGEVMQSGLVERFSFHSCVYTFLAGLITQPDCVFQVIVSDDFHSDCHLHNTPLYRKVFKCTALLVSDENKKDETRSLQHQLSHRVLSKISKRSIGGISQNYCGRYHQGSVQSARLGFDRTIGRTRPRPHLRVCSANIFSDVRSESFERNDGCQSHQRTPFCRTILESKLLCRNGRNSHRTNHQEIYSRTRIKEVTSQFTTEFLTRCPLAT